MRTVPLLGLAAALALLAGQFAPAQEAPKGPPAKPMAVYQQFRGLVAEGKYDLAALFLRAFVESNPSDQDLLDIEARYGTTVFRQLRNIPRWSDDPKLDREARANVEELIKRSTAATEKVLRNPDRVNKYIRNLGGPADPGKTGAGGITYEERVFAELELKRTGDYAVPFMVDTLRANAIPEVSAGILGAIPKLEGPTMAGWVAALDGLEPDRQYGVISSIVSRPDRLDLLNAAQTDYLPYLWRVAGNPNTSPALRSFARRVLEELVRGAERRQPEAELVAIARTFADRKARYMSTKTNPDGSANTVPVWVWDAKAQKLVKMEDVPATQADEYYGLRYARWALEIRPNYEPAHALILGLATERAVERANFADLARAEPAVYKMLADAPATVLTDLLDRALSEKRTALAFAVAQVLGDRAERAAATPGPGGRPSLFERALNYPDPRVQLAAANALLRSPVPVDPKVRARVVEILKRAAATDTGGPPGAKGKVLLTDPDRKRAGDLAALLRSMGYDVEHFGQGRDLLRRVAKASDFDLIVVDRHVVSPELRDVIGHLRADANAARRPVLVVASADETRPPSLDMLLLRFALLIAATETDPVGMPPPYVPDLKRTAEEQAADRATVQQRRDGVFRSTAETRKARLLRVLATSGLELNPAQRFLVELRVEQVTYAVLAAEYPLTPESSPEAARHVDQLNRQIREQPPVPPYVRRTGVDHLMKMIERLEPDVMRVPAAKARYEGLRPLVDVDALGLVIESTRDFEAEARVSRLVQGFPAVGVIPEPYSRVGFEDDLRAAFQDPADAPRDPAEKKAAARLAVEWLARMATGEVAGFDARTAEPELRAALRNDDLAEPAIDGVARFPSADAQQALVTLAVTPGRPLPLRVKAADAAIRHVQTHGKLTPGTLADPVAAQSGTEPDPTLRGKLMVLKGLLAPDPKGYTADLQNYTPPLVRPPAKKEPTPKEPMPKEPMPKEPAMPPAPEPNPKNP